MKEYKTDTGTKLLNDDELVKEAYKTIRKVLKTKYTKYRDLHDDIEQEVISTVYKAVIKRYSPDKGTLEAFLYGIAKRQIAQTVQQIQKEPPTVRLTDEMLCVIHTQNDRNLENAELFEQLVEEFGKTLTAKERKALNLKIDGLTNTQIYNEMHRRKPKKRIGQAMTALWKSVGKKYITWRNKQCKSISTKSKD